MVEVIPFHHPNQIIWVVVKSGYHLNIEKAFIKLLFKQENVRMLTHFRVKDSTSNTCVEGRKYAHCR